MSKLAFFFLSLVGAVPAGGTLYLLINNFLDRSDRLGGLLLGVNVAATVCMVLVALSPFIVLVFYKDTRGMIVKADAAAAVAAGAGGAVAAAAASKKSEDEFGDVIPADFDEDELAASGGGDEYEDEYEDGEYDEGEFDDFDMDDYE